MLARFIRTNFLKTAPAVLTALSLLWPVAAIGQQPLKPGDTPPDAPTSGSVAPPIGSGPLDSLAASFPAGEAQAFADLLASGLPPGVTGDTFGHLLFARRHFDRAAWFFGTAAQGDGASASSLSNYAATLAMTAETLGGSAQANWLPEAMTAAQAAATIAPNEAAIQNNLGNVARLTGDLALAVAAGRQATALAPDEALYWTNLARSLDAAGDHDAAGAALARAHALEPNGAALIVTAPTLPAAAGSYAAARQNQCNIDFRCMDICPRSIIGGLMTVTCEIENSSARMACSEGRPYATSYDCTEDIPEYGILIPGLNSGFSVSVPGFSMHVVVQGDGRVDVRVEAGAGMGPLGGYMRADGHFSPTNGASFDNLGGGVRLNLLPMRGMNQTLSDYGHPPIHIEAETLDGHPPQINLETYNAGLISY